MINRGQIYLVQLDPTIGSEIKKTRPSLVVSNNANNHAANTVTVLPISSQTKAVRLFDVLLPAKLGGLKVDSKAKADQIRTVDKQRLSSHPLGATLPPKTMQKVSTAIKIHLDIY